MKWSPYKTNTMAERIHTVQAGRVRSCDWTFIDEFVGTQCAIVRTQNRFNRLLRANEMKTWPDGIRKADVKYLFAFVVCVRWRQWRLSPHIRAISMLGAHNQKLEIIGKMGVRPATVTLTSDVKCVVCKWCFRNTIEMWAHGIGDTCEAKSPFANQPSTHRI